MANKDKDEKDGSKETKEESRKAKDSDDEGEITAVKPEHGEPADNLKRRGEWFQKRH
jgi:hypothetical protein